MMGRFWGQFKGRFWANFEDNFGPILRSLLVCFCANSGWILGTEFEANFGANFEANLGANFEADFWVDLGANFAGSDMGLYRATVG
jgi:hypothetical protein